MESSTHLSDVPVFPVLPLWFDEFGLDLPAGSPWGVLA